MTRGMIVLVWFVSGLLAGCDGGSSADTNMHILATSSSSECRQVLNDLISNEMYKPEYKSFKKHTLKNVSIYYADGSESQMKCVGKYLKSDLDSVKALIRFQAIMD